MRLQQRLNEGLMAKQQRGNAYLLERLKIEHPALYGDLQAGKFKSPREALIAAGLKQQAKPLNDLKRAWSKASLAEQAEFRRLIGMSKAVVTTAALSTHSAVGRRIVPAPSVPASLPPAASGGVVNNVIDADRHLKPWADVRIQLIMKVRRMKMRGVLDEIGYTRLDQSLTQALNGGTRIQLHMAAALEKWLDDNKAVN